MFLGEVQNRRKVSVLIGETSSEMRSALRQGLRAVALSNITEIFSEAELRKPQVVDSWDIAILDQGLTGNITQAVEDIRKGRTGINPFLVIVLTSWRADSLSIRSMINSGADEILLKPLAVSVLLERLNSLLSRRKPFLSTQDYVGPDRRGGREDPNAPGQNLIQPPNTFREKIEGHPIVRDKLISQIRTAQMDMFDQRLCRDVRRIGNLSHSVAAAARGEGPGEKMFSELDQLVSLGRELGRHVDTASRTESGDILSRLHQVAAGLKAHLPEVDREEATLLESIAGSVIAAFEPVEARRRIADCTAIFPAFYSGAVDAGLA